jgi:hypothetical protein
VSTLPGGLARAVTARARWLAVLLALASGCAVEDAGEPCGRDSDCERECFSDRLFSSEGICTSRCGPNTFTPCPLDWACVDVGNEDYWCLAECGGFFGRSCAERFGRAWSCESLPLEDGGHERVCID